MGCSLAERRSIGKEMERSQRKRRHPSTQVYQVRKAHQRWPFWSQRACCSSNYSKFSLKRNRLDRSLYHSEPLLSRQSSFTDARHPRNLVDRSLWLWTYRPLSTSYRGQRRVRLLVPNSLAIASTESTLVRPPNFEKNEIVLVRFWVHDHLPDYSGIHVPLVELCLDSMSSRYACYRRQS